MPALRRWVDDGSDTRILRGEYPKGQDDATASAREDVAEATRHSRSSFERSPDPPVSFLRDLSGGVGAVKDKVGTWFGRAGATDDDEATES